MFSKLAIVDGAESLWHCRLDMIGSHRGLIRSLRSAPSRISAGSRRGFDLRSADRYSGAPRESNQSETLMDIKTGAGRGADRGRPAVPDRRGLRAAVAVATVAAITAAAGALVLGGQAAAVASTLKAGAEADTRYFGVAVGQEDVRNSSAANLAGSQFDMVTPQNEMKWDTVEPNRGQFNFGPGDAIVSFATSHNQRLRGH